MAFFKFRQRGQQGDAPATGGSQESIDSLRRRARHRLVGAAVLVLAAVIGFPLLFDTQPRPVAVDAPITIPDKDKITPLQVPASAGLAEREEILPPSPPAPPAQPPSVPASQPAAPAHPASAPRPAQADTRAADEAKSQREAERVRALLAGKKPPPAEHAPAPDASAAAGKGRFIIQIGAFADEAKVREVRQQAERSGLKTYTQAVDTKDGKRTRVRVGPYASRAEADKAAATLKKAGLPVAILSL